MKASSLNRWGIHLLTVRKITIISTIKMMKMWLDRLRMPYHIDSDYQVIKVKLEKCRIFKENW